MIREEQKKNKGLIFNNALKIRNVDAFLIMMEFALWINNNLSVACNSIWNKKWFTALGWSSISKKCVVEYFVVTFGHISE